MQKLWRCSLMSVFGNFVSSVTSFHKNFSLDAVRLVVLTITYFEISKTLWSFQMKYFILEISCDFNIHFHQTNLTYSTTENITFQKTHNLWQSSKQYSIHQITLATSDESENFKYLWFIPYTFCTFYELSG